MAKFRPIDLSEYFNAPARLRPGSGRTRFGWHRSAAELFAGMPGGKQTSWGIPFVLGPRDVHKKGLLVVGREYPEVTIPLNQMATHVCILHFCNLPEDPDQNAAGGEHLADYLLRYRDGSEYATVIRRRFEVAPFTVEWGRGPFAAVDYMMPRAPRPEDGLNWGRLQTGVTEAFGGFRAWLYALENPAPGKRLSGLVLRWVGKEPIGVLGITLYRGQRHPLRHLPRSLFRVVLPPNQSTESIQAELDMGNVTRAYAVPYRTNQKWLKAADHGLGRRNATPRPRRAFLVEASGAPDATLTIATREGKKHSFTLGQIYSEPQVAGKAGQARIEVLHPRKTWAHVTVIDSSTGKPTPARVHFSGSQGEYLPPYGHHRIVNDNWFEDYGGDLQLGGMSYAYVPGQFQIELPVGAVYVEVTKGFEYEPLRRKLDVRPGTRRLSLKIHRWTDRSKENWVTADTHVHFISPQTAWLEGQAEGLNLINLLASQWGRLFTNVGDITGGLSGCSRDDTLVWVGTENRHHLLGHISLLGTHGSPVFPMCAGGPSEAYLGDPDVTTVTGWAKACRERQGLAIRPHFPAPICEEPVYFLMGELDGTELRYFPNPDKGTLEQFCFQEWYRYLNCGYRVAAVGGTDKMSAGMPVGGVRTYARLDPNQPFTFESWANAIRAGRSFTTSGPLLDLVVEGHTIGDEIRLPAGGGKLEVEASAGCVWPIHLLELVVNGRVVASASSKGGTKTLQLKEKVELKGSSWIAARAGSKLVVQHCWPIHLGAHTSPVYVRVGKQQMFSPSDAQYMLTLIDGGLTYLDTLSVRYSEKRHRKLKAVFQQTRRKLSGQLRAHTHTHTHKQH